MTKEQIRELREALGYSQVDFAVALGTTPTSISRWERGIRAPSRLAAHALKRLEAETLREMAGVLP